MLTRRLVRIRAMQALYAFFVQKESLSANSENIAHPEEQLAKDIEMLRATHMHYWQMMLFWARLDEEEIAKKASRPQASLGLIPFFARLKEDKFFVKYRKTYPLNVVSTLLKRWYHTYIAPHKLYIQYQEKGSKDLKESCAFLAGFFTNIFPQATEIQDHFKAQWFDEELFSPVLAQCVMFFISHFAKGSVKRFSLYEAKTFEHQNNFYTTLSTCVLDNSAAYDATIKKYSHNWDMHRLILLDKLLLKMALAEIAAFPEQPKSVIVNEYIEIAKTYSSPKSYRFINGLLDAMIPDKSSK